MTTRRAPRPDPSATISAGRLPRAASVTGDVIGATVTVTAGLLAGYGWLYVLRGLSWFGLGPPVPDALPLLQLAGFDRQPLLRVLLAWLLAGAIVGVALIRASPSRRAVLAGALGLVLLLVASQAADAVTRNLKLSDVLLRRRPGLGPVLEAVVFAIGCLLPRRSAGTQGRGRRSFPAARGLGRRGQPGLGGGQHR